MIQKSLVLFAAGTIVLAASVFAKDITISPGDSLAKARDATKVGDRVVLRGGTYLMTEPLVLGPQHSGVTWMAAKGETPVLTSAREITGWKVADPATPGLVECAKGKVWVADVPKGWCFHFLYLDGQPATRSRSVNHDNWRQWGRNYSFDPATPTGQVVRFHDKLLLKDLPSNGDVEMCAIIYQFGVMGGGVMTDFDPVKGTGVWHSKQLNLQRPNKARRAREVNFRLENALAFIDEPGEWAVDSAAGKVYYWPFDSAQGRPAGEDLKTIKVSAPMLTELIRLQGDDSNKKYVHHVIFEGLTLSCTDRLAEDKWPDHWPVRQWENPGAMIFMEGVEDCAVRNCRLYRSGAYGVTLLRHALRNEVSGNEIGWTGSGGVQLFGFGAGFRDENRFNVVSSNYIHDQGCSIYWHSPGIQIFGSADNSIEYNFLALSAYNNISITGMPFAELNNWKAVAAGRHTMTVADTTAFAVDFSTYPSNILAQVKAGIPYFTAENYRELAVHSRSNKVYRNIAIECCSRLEEGGSIYAWCTGKGNQWMENVVYTSHSLPGSSILALDDRSEYFTVKGNVVWTEGRAGCGTIGMRPTEKGNVFSGNIRAMYKPEYRDAGRCTAEPGRVSFDKLYNSIKAEVDKAGGWPGNPDIDAWIEKLKNRKDRFDLTPAQIKAMMKVM